MGDAIFAVHISKVNSSGSIQGKCEGKIAASEDGKMLKIEYNRGRIIQEEIPMSCFKPVCPLPASSLAKAIHIDGVPENEHNIQMLKVECEDNGALRQVHHFFEKHIGKREKTKGKKPGIPTRHLANIANIESPSAKLAREREKSRLGSRVVQPPHSATSVSGTLSTHCTPSVPKRIPRIYTDDRRAVENSTFLHIKQTVNDSKGRKRTMGESARKVIEEPDQVLVSDWKKSKIFAVDQSENADLPGPSDILEAPDNDDGNTLNAIDATLQLRNQSVAEEDIEEKNEKIHPFRYRSMRNLGNSCYMNASLQALTSSPNFIRSFLAAVPTVEDQQLYAMPKRADVLNAVANVYRHIYSCRDASLDRCKKIQSAFYQGNRGGIPTALLKNVRQAAGACLDEEFATTSQQDAHEFLSTFLDLMKDNIGQKQNNAKSTNSPTSSDKENGPPPEELEQVPQRKIEEEFSELGFFEKKMEPGRQVRVKNPSQEFKIDCVANIGCLRCGWSTKKVDTALDLQVAIKDGDVSIKTLIDSQLEREQIEYKCESCGTLGPAFISTSFQQLPETLIVVVKRYQYTKYGEAVKFEKDVTVDRELFLKDLCEGSEAKLRECVAFPRNSGMISDGMSKISDGRIADMSSSQVSPVKNVFGVPGSPKKGLITSSPRKGRRLTMSQQSDDVFDTQNSTVCDSQEVDHMEVTEDDVPFEIHENSSLDGCRTPSPTNEERPASPIELFSDEEVNGKPQTGGGEAPENTESDRPVNKASESPDKGISHQELTVAPKREQSSSADSIIITEEKKANSVKWLPLTAEHIMKIQRVLEIEENEEESIEAWRKSFLFIGNNCRALSSDTPAIIEAEADGNCLFRCVSWYILNGQQVHHDTIRARVCNFIQTFKEHFAPFVAKDITIDEHIMSMKEDGSWGTQVELTAMATFFQCCIFSHFQGRWTQFKPLFNFKHRPVDGYEFLNRDIDVDEILEKNGSIYISNPDNVHFSIVSAPEISLAPEIVTNEEKVDYPFTTTQNGYDFNDDLEAAKPHTPNLLEFEPDDIKNYENTFSDPESMNAKETYVYREEDDPVYTLTAVVNHSGNSLRYGHYTSYVFDSERNVWLYCNDASITKVDESVVLRDSSSTGYMFLYRRRHLNDSEEFKQSDFTFS